MGGFREVCRFVALSVWISLGPDPGSGLKGFRRAYGDGIARNLSLSIDAIGQRDSMQ